MQLDLEVKQELQQRFVFISLLGKGSFGCVYECEDKTDRQIYAVKIISKNNVKKSKMECLREEARLLSSINHANIVKVYEFVETNTFIFLRMEIIRNGTLQKLITDRWSSGQKFSDDEMAAIMGSIFRSLHYIHSINIIHRDIKPENILLPSYDDFSKLKMADFGLSTKLDFYYPKTATSKCGTMLFMAPEILNNLSYSKSVDIWSCSIIMFIIANGKHPFYQSKMTTEDYKQKIKHVVFPPLSNSLAQDFLTRIAKIEPIERYTAQQALKHPWLTRNFDDEIPQSLHESFQGFEKSHTISNVFKLLLTSKYLLCQQNKIEIPQKYLLKKQKVDKESHSLNIKKLKSKKLEKDCRSSPFLKKADINPKEKESEELRNKENEKDNPAILKLNKIFDTLLDRKPRNKEKEKMPTEGALLLKETKEKTETPPKYLTFKEKLECEIDRFVREFKSEEVSRMANPLRKMLPSKKKKIIGDFIGEKDEFRISTDSSSSSNFKIRYRRKQGSALKLYE